MKRIHLLMLFLTACLVVAQAQSNLDQRAAELLKQMTLEEKASLLSGKDFWASKPIERLKVPSIWLSDGPHGLRKAALGNNIGIGNSVPATCFPTASALASSWNTDLVNRVGQAIGQEAQAQGVQIVLGPGVNLKRSPLGGRNFEYYSEDPMLSGEMAVAFINGVQSQGVGTSLKHFAFNEQETNRMTINSKLDERAMRELYLLPFELAVKKAQPWTVMASYNKVYNTYATENTWLLTDILRKDWGFKGIVMTDWGAVNDRVAGVKAGLNLEMPGSNGVNDKLVVEAVKAGKLSESELDEVVLDWLKVILQTDANRKNGAAFDAKMHHDLARMAAEESIVLLKNVDNILPLDKNKLKKMAIIGDFAKNPRYQGAGSSQVNPTQMDNAFASIQNLVGKSVTISYSQGYGKSDQKNEALIQDAVAKAKAAEVAILFVGLPPSYESEGFDRKHMDMPESHNALIEAVAKAQPNTIVVLSNGSAVSMPWLASAKAVVEGWLTGQAGASAMVNVLFGVVNPSGKLSETFPKRLADNPSYLSFPGENGEVTYSEGLFMGYRYYDTKQIEPQFHFGYGLSYTEFEYKNLKINKSAFKDTEGTELSVSVKNVGKRAGKETVQLYVRDVASRLQRPEKELKAFAKVDLKPGEEKMVTFQLSERDFAFYDPAVKDWVTESGDFEILIGSSSRLIRLRQTITLETTKVKTPKLDRYSTIQDWLNHPKGKVFVQPMLNSMMGGFGDANERSEEEKRDMQMMMSQMPMIKLVIFSGGAFSMQMLDGMLAQVNQ